MEKSVAAFPKQIILSIDACGEATRQLANRRIATQGWSMDPFIRARFGRNRGAPIDCSLAHAPRATHVPAPLSMPSGQLPEQTRPDAHKVRLPTALVASALRHHAGACGGSAVADIFCWGSVEVAPQSGQTSAARVGRHFVLTWVIGPGSGRALMAPSPASAGKPIYGRFPYQLTGCPFLRPPQQSLVPPPPSRATAVVQREQALPAAGRAQFLRPPHRCHDCARGR